MGQTKFELIKLSPLQIELTSAERSLDYTEVQDLLSQRMHAGENQSHGRTEAK